MNEDLAGESPESAGVGGGYSCMRLLDTLKREEILEVLSEGFCSDCEARLKNRVLNLMNKKVSEISFLNDSTEHSTEFWSNKRHHPQESVPSNPIPRPESVYSARKKGYTNNSKSLTPRSRQQESLSLNSSRMPESVYSAKKKGYVDNSSPASVYSHWHSFEHSSSETLLNDELLDDQREQIRFSEVGREKDFAFIERINGRPTNVLQGLELHTRVFNAEEQSKIVEFVYKLQRMGQNGQLRDRTYSEPRKWMPGKGRVTIQFGCCYNYAVDKNGNPPGIIRDEEVDPLPLLFKEMIKRMVRWHVLPPTCIPNSCIVNIYEEGDCIPPHIDHHDFVRPFCTVSFLAECNILFGRNLKIVGPGEFSGPVSIPLPVGSVLILNGNGADVAKHCVPAVPAKRISITFRKMDDSKLPYKFSSDADSLGIKPLVDSPLFESPHQPKSQMKSTVYSHSDRSSVQQNHGKLTGSVELESNNSFFVEKNDFPPLGSSNSANRLWVNKAGSK